MQRSSGMGFRVSSPATERERKQQKGNSRSKEPEPRMTLFECFALWAHQTEETMGSTPLSPRPAVQLTPCQPTPPSIDNLLREPPWPSFLGPVEAAGEEVLEATSSTTLRLSLSSTLGR